MQVRYSVIMCVHFYYNVSANDYGVLYHGNITASNFNHHSLLITTKVIHCNKHYQTILCLPYRDPWGTKDTVCYDRRECHLYLQHYWQRGTLGTECNPNDQFLSRWKASIWGPGSNFLGGHPSTILQPHNDYQCKFGTQQYCNILHSFRFGLYYGNESGGSSYYIE